MPIHRLLQEASFNQDDIQRMVEAFDIALRVLHLTDRTDPMTEMVAQKIIGVFADAAADWR